MHCGCAVLLLLASVTWSEAGGKSVTYTVDDTDYEGYYVSPGKDAPLVLLIHDWDGLTEYECKRADLLAG